MQFYKRIPQIYVLDAVQSIFWETLSQGLSPEYSKKGKCFFHFHFYVFEKTLKNFQLTLHGCQSVSPCGRGSQQ